jgi:hypothetical protein
MTTLSSLFYVIATPFLCLGYVLALAAWVINLPLPFSLFQVKILHWPVLELKIVGVRAGILTSLFHPQLTLVVLITSVSSSSGAAKAEAVLKCRQFGLGTKWQPHAQKSF